jgi:hypothetical protein
MTTAPPPSTSGLGKLTRRRSSARPAGNGRATFASAPAVPWTGSTGASTTAAGTGSAVARSLRARSGVGRAAAPPRGDVEGPWRRFGSASPTARRSAIAPRFQAVPRWKKGGRKMRPSGDSGCRSVASEELVVGSFGCIARAAALSPVNLGQVPYCSLRHSSRCWSSESGSGAPVAKQRCRRVGRPNELLGSSSKPRRGHGPDSDATEVSCRVVAGAIGVSTTRGAVEPRGALVHGLGRRVLG